MEKYGTQTAARALAIQMLEEEREAGALNFIAIWGPCGTRTVAPASQIPIRAEDQVVAATAMEVVATREGRVAMGLGAITL
jgi:hypothetical protein